MSWENGLHGVGGKVGEGGRVGVRCAESGVHWVLWGWRVRLGTEESDHDDCVE